MSKNKNKKGKSQPVKSQTKQQKSEERNKKNEIDSIKPQRSDEDQKFVGITTENDLSRSCNSAVDHEDSTQLKLEEEENYLKAENEYLKNENQKLRKEIEFLKKNIEKLQEQNKKQAPYQQDISSASHSSQIKREEDVQMDVDTPDFTNAGACSIEFLKFSHCSQQTNLINTNDTKENWDDDITYFDNVGASSKEFQNVPHCGQQKDLIKPNDVKKNWEAEEDWSNYSNYDRNKGKRNKGKYEHRTSEIRNQKQSHHSGSRKKVSEIDGDLFTAPEDHSLAHCVAQDLKMGSGIAITFKQKFKRLHDLLDQRKKVGQVAILDDQGRYIYYLISKKHSEGKPRMSDLHESLINMKEHILHHEVKNLAIPRIGCGLDRLSWSEVRQMLEDVFHDVDIKITVYNFTVETPSTSSLPKRKMYVVNKKRQLVDMEHNTLLILFGSVSGHIDETMEEVNKKFPIITEYRNKLKQLGDIIYLTIRNEMLAILIVKKSENDYLSYKALEKSLLDLRKVYKKERYEYMGFEAFLDGDDDTTVTKVTSIFKTAFMHIPNELYVCWPPKLEDMFIEPKGQTGFRSSDIYP